MQTHPKILGALVAFLLLLHGNVVIALAQESQPSSVANAPSNMEDLVRDGNWAEAYELARHHLDTDSKSAKALFVRNLARKMALMEPKPGGILSRYDYPFTDATASAELKRWVTSLKNRYGSNANILSVIATHQVLADNDTQQTMKTLEKILSADPDHVFALASVGTLYGASNRLSDAIRVSKKAIKINPECASAYNNLGMVAMSRRDFTKAEEYFKKATSLKSAGAMDWFNLGSLYYYQQNMLPALSALEKAVSLSPKLIEAHYNLAGVCYNLGDRASSIKHLKIILEAAPSSPYSEKALQNLQQLGVKQ